jgi:hypothetical protein
MCRPVIGHMLVCDFLETQADNAQYGQQHDKSWVVKGSAAQGQDHFFSSDWRGAKYKRLIDALARAI